MEKRKKKILIIEDDIAISAMYQVKFEKSGYRAYIANDGSIGLTLAKEEFPDLILLDVIMPQLDGFSVLEELKKDEETKNIPVIMLTNLGTEEDKERGRKLGAIDYWIKVDIDPAKVSEQIEKYL
jgi:DNA-binding response OmpR family regulator